MDTTLSLRGSGSESAVDRTALDNHQRRNLDSAFEFWSTIIDSSLQDDTVNDRKRLDCIARWFSADSWDDFKPDGIETTAQLRASFDRASFADSPLSQGCKHGPPMTGEQQRTCLASIGRCVNRLARDAVHDDVHLPDFIGPLMQLTGWLGTPIPAARYGSCAFNVSPSVGSDDLSVNAVQILQDYHKHEWEIVTGWQTSLDPDFVAFGVEVHPSSYVLYARKTTADADLDEREFKWRIYIEDASNPSGHGRWFAGLSTLLEYQSEWLSRLPEGWERRIKPPTWVQGESFTDDEANEAAGEDHPEWSEED